MARSAVEHVGRGFARHNGGEYEFDGYLSAWLGMSG